jgi:hypothetical protein
MRYKVTPRYTAKFLAGHYVGQHSFILGNAPLLRCYSTHKAVTKKILERRLPSKTFPPKKVGSFENHVIFPFFSHDTSQVLQAKNEYTCQVYAK